MMDDLKREYWTTHQAAIKLGVTPTTVIKWINDGHIKVRKTLGKHRRIPDSEIQRVYSLMESRND